MNVKTIGIDLAKNVFQIHGVDEHGKRLFNKQLRRAQMASFFANIPPCLIGMEACASAHFWANKLISMGHNVKLMAPQFVKPYVKTNKHDAADAEAICEAVTRPKEGANKQVISSQADSLIKISRIWADFFPANNRISLFRLFFPPFLALFPVFTEISPTDVSFGPPETGWPG
ncbi:transposase [Klebsiella pneumoniae]